MKFLKVLLRSRSLAFARDYSDAQMGVAAENEIHEFSWNGRPVFYRPGTSDPGLIYDILLKKGEKGEYWLPEEVAPSVILDIGANIGVTSRYLAYRFPKARIYSFEPIQENYELLKKNLSGFENVRVFPFGLGATSEQVDFVIPTGAAGNKGGFSLFADAKPGEAVTKRGEIRAAADALKEIGVSAVDLIKIDTEGAEFLILSAIPTDIIKSVKWIYGELHTEDLAASSDFKTLDYLSQWFAVEVRKPLHKRNYPFDACNRVIKDQFRSFARK